MPENLKILSIVRSAGMLAPLKRWIPSLACLIVTNHWDVEKKPLLECLVDVLCSSSVQHLALLLVCLAQNQKNLGNHQRGSIWFIHQQYTCGHWKAQPIYLPMSASTIKEQRTRTAQNVHGLPVLDLLNWGHILTDQSPTSVCPPIF